MSRPDPPYSDRDPRYLSDGEFRVLTNWRLSEMEDRLDSIVRALWTMAGGIIVGVVVFFLTVGRPAAHQALSALGLM